MKAVLAIAFLAYAVGTPLDLGEGLSDGLSESSRAVLAAIKTNSLHEVHMPHHRRLGEDVGVSDAMDAAQRCHSVESCTRLSSLA